MISCLWNIIWLAYWLGHNPNLPNILLHYRWKDFLKLEEQLQASVESTSKDQTCLDSMGFRTAKYKADSREQRKYVHSVAMNLIVDCDLPVNIVTRPGFIRHHENLNTLYNTIDR